MPASDVKAEQSPDSAAELDAAIFLAQKLSVDEELLAPRKIKTGKIGQDKGQ